jgi:hypothetical protein
LLTNLRKVREWYNSIEKQVKFSINFRSLSPASRNLKCLRKKKQDKQKKRYLSQKKANETLEDPAARLEKLKKSRENRKTLETVQERDLK